MFPLLVVVVALVLTWWSARRRPQRIEAVHATVTAMCTTACGGGDRATAMAAVDPLLRGSLASALEPLCAAIAGDPGSLRVTVAEGPGAGPGTLPAGPAPTHHAVVHVGDEARLGLQVIDDDAVRIVGYWQVP
jgi:hypothetical protein